MSYKFNRLYDYPRSMRTLVGGKRHYDIREEKLPSVTTILSACQSPEKKASLEAWRQRLGPKTADIARDLAAERGTAMHKYLEHYIDGTGLKDLTTLGMQAETMATKIIESGLRDLEEVWGSEVTLYYPDLYAGATDVVGIYNGRESIIDFKQTNKPKKEEWITDYKLQLAAYAMAHNYMHKTNITKGVIMMCSKDNYYQEFIVEGKEFQEYKHKWLGKVSEYYEDRRKNEEAKQSL